MAFEKFTNTARIHNARVSIGKQGILTLTSAALAIYGIKNYTHVVLFFDRDTKQIAFQLTSDAEAEGARKIRFRSYGADISLAAFLHYFGVKFDKITRHELIEQDGMLVLKTLRDVER